MKFSTVLEGISNNPYEWSREVGMQMAKLEEERIKNALVGSKITDIEYNPIPNRKTMYELVIKTDAPRVARLQFGSGYMLENRALIQESDRHFFDLSEIRVRTKTRPPFRGFDKKANEDE